MKSTFPVLLSLIFLLRGMTTHANAENWPAWRGPSANGISREANLPVKWTKSDNIAWRLALPAWSGSTPIIWGERIFLSVADGKDIWLWSIDKSRGVPIWKKHLSAGD